MNRPNNSTQQITKLLQLDASELLAWQKDAWTGKLPIPEEFNWLGMAEVAAFNANSKINREKSLQWAKVAISTYEYLIKNADLAGKNSFVCSLMNLRACMIIRHGTVPQDCVLDIKHVIDLFFFNTHMSYTEAATKATAWKDLSMRDIQELRRIKNRLSALKLLSDTGKIIPNQELKNWLHLREQLP
jgi:hypothetical protein